MLKEMDKKLTRKIVMSRRGLHNWDFTALYYSVEDYILSDRNII